MSVYRNLIIYSTFGVLLFVTAPLLAEEPSAVSEQEQSFQEYKRQQAAYARILEASERDQARYEKILRRWEEQQDEYQKYLDSLKIKQ